MTGMHLFALEASRSFGEAAAAQLGIKLSLHEERDFDDGEHKTRPLVSVRGADVFVIHSLYGAPEQSASEKLCRLLFFIGTLRDAGAERVTAVTPYLCYARKDRRTKLRDPVTISYVARLFEAVGTARLVTLDVHNVAAVENAFRCPVEHLEARPLFVEHIAERIAERPLVVVSPDAGGVKRARALQRALEDALARPIPLAFMDKHRSEDVVSAMAFLGDVEGRTALIVDDIIASGTTIVRAARACLEHGAEGVWALASHGVFAGEAATAIADEALDRVVVTDTIPPFRLPETLVQEKLELLSVANLFARAIGALHRGESLEAVLGHRTAARV